MKKIFLALLVFGSVNSFAQFPSHILPEYSKIRFVDPLLTDSSFLLPLFTDTVEANKEPHWRGMVILLKNGTVYIRNGLGYWMGIGIPVDTIKVKNSVFGFYDDSNNPILSRKPLVINVFHFGFGQSYQDENIDNSQALKSMLTYILRTQTCKINRKKEYHKPTSKKHK